ncbi:MAG: nucleotidyltransferase family protein [Limisphaerales bacterium]
MHTRLHLVAVILGAGRSRRMGKPKLLLPWHGSTILAHQVETWLQLGADVRVVCGPRPDPIQDELDRLHVSEQTRILNPRPDDGMFSSIRCAARAPWPAETTHFSIILGDQPHLKRATLEKLLHTAEEEFDSICQPRHNGALCHPVILPRKYFTQLADTEAQILSDFLHGQQIEPSDVDDPGLELDIDVAADYEAALRVESAH